MTRHLLISGAIVALAVAILFLVTENSTLAIFPSESIAIDTYHEALDSNFSKASIDLNNNGQVQFKYELAESLEEPFAAAFFQAKGVKKNYLDISSFDQLEIELKASRSERIPINFTIDYEGFTDTIDNNTNVPFRQIIDYDQSEALYTLPLSDFAIPSWWYRAHRTSEEDFPNLDFSRVNYVVVGSCMTIGPGGKDMITISSITFSHNNTKVHLLVGTSTVFLLGVYFFLSFLRKNKKVVITYEPAEVSNTKQEQRHEVEQFISTHYKNPELSLDLVAKEVGLSTRDVSKHIKERSEKSFKEYINAIRVAEVKRLLKDSELPVSDIAYAVGYSNISHFNRVFKGLEGKSPKEFRAQYDEDIPGKNS